MSNDGRVCVTDKEWDDMSLEEKVEVLGKWAVEMTKWAEGLDGGGMALDGGGGGLPPKHPKDPYC